jgi:hypothetical protein
VEREKKKQGKCSTWRGSLQALIFNIFALAMQLLRVVYNFSYQRGP